MQTLPAACFKQDRSSIDGLKRLCTDCSREYNKSRKQPLARVKVPSKRCCECKVKKPAACFHAMQIATDGLRPTCKECSRIIQQRQQQQRQQ